MRYLHTMLRVRDLPAALDFFVGKLGLREVRRHESAAGRFTLVALFSGGQQGYYSVTARGATPFPPVPQP